MLKLTVQHQESYSRGDLILRTLFGFIYIGIPHLVVMMFVGIYTAILGFIAWWVVLFTGKYPRNWFDVQVNMAKWSLRLNARFLNLSDGYPAIGLSGADDKTSLDVPYPETLSR